MSKPENREIKQLTEIVIAQSMKKIKSKYGASLPDTALAAFLTVELRDWFNFILKTNKHNDADMLLDPTHKT